VPGTAGREDRAFPESLPARPMKTLPPWALALLCCSLAKAPGAADNPLTDNRQRLEQMQARIKELSNSLGSDRGLLDDYQQELRGIERKISQTAMRLKQLDTELGQQRAAQEQLKRQEQQQLTYLERQRELLARQMRAAYVMGRQERIKLLLNQQDPERLSRLVRYHDYLNQQRVRQLEQIKALLAELAKTRDQVTNEERRSEDLRQQVLRQQQEQEASKQQRDKVLQGLARKIMDKDKELLSLKQNEKDLQTLIHQLQQAMLELAKQNPWGGGFQRQKGNLIWPLPGKLAASFGSPRSSGLTWDGVFIQAREGSEVKAVHPGRVAFADWLRGFGLLLIIDHGDGFMTLYGHNQGLLKAVGDPVEQGETIAQAGNGGGSLSSGIYFRIRHQGKPVNPADWCKAGDPGQHG
jgi:murein hydrolase activator